MLIIDASVAVKWFLPEKDSNKAEALLLSGQRLIAPEIIRIEVAAAFTRLLRTGDFDRPTVETKLQKWQHALTQQAISLERTSNDFKTATKISMDIGHQLQDCLYVATAKRLNAPLITADKKLLKKADAVNCQLQALDSSH